MEIRQLRYFEAVAREGHFTRAAEELHVAQSALSHQVRRLELELGVELLRRTTRSVELTEAGRLVAARARAVLAETDALRGEIDDLRGLLRGQVSVGAMLFGGELDIPAILASFTARFPGIEIGLREGTAQRMVEMLHDGSLDITFALEVDPPDGIERLALSSESLALATSTDHPLAGARPLPITALAGQPLIAFQHGSSTRRLVDAALARAGVHPRISLEANDFALVRSLVAQGVGLAILPRSFLERPGPAISFRPLSPGLRMPVVLWWRRGRTLSPAARAFVEFSAAQRVRGGSPPAAADRRRGGA
jgi:LysR family transcriptional regulator, transcription activator of glutamate synthase operon